MRILAVPIALTVAVILYLRDHPNATEESAQAYFGITDDAWPYVIQSCLAFVEAMADDSGEETKGE